QTETMTGREWQNALYVRDRWRVTQNLTLNLGLRLENYPLMSRENSGLERLDYSTYTVLLGGRGGVPKDVGLKLQTWYLAPRLGAAYRIGEKSVVRAGYGRTLNPLLVSPPAGGSFPLGNSLQHPRRSVRLCDYAGQRHPRCSDPGFQFRAGEVAGASFHAVAELWR